jgi:hypothetical protein
LSSFSKLKPAQYEEILRRYQAGDRPVDIGRDFDLTWWTVQNVRKRAGVPARPHGVGDSAIARAIKLKAGGLSVPKIAMEIGYEARTVTKELRTHGVSARRSETPSTIGPAASREPVDAMSVARVRMVGAIVVACYLELCSTAVVHGKIQKERYAQA